MALKKYIPAAALVAALLLVNACASTGDIGGTELPPAGPAAFSDNLSSPAPASSGELPGAIGLQLIGDGFRTPASHSVLAREARLEIGSREDAGTVVRVRQPETRG